MLPASGLWGGLILLGRAPIVGNVAVYLGSTKNCVEGKHPEDEHRIFYVAVTRCKENPYLIESDKSYRYEI